MKAEEWFSQMLEESRNRPDFIADEMALQIVADVYKAMLREGLTKKQLAERIGVSPAFVSQVLNGKPNMTLVTVAKFALALNLDCHIELRAKQDEAPQHSMKPSQRRKAPKPASQRRSRRAATTPV